MILVKLIGQELDKFQNAYERINKKVIYLIIFRLNFDVECLIFDIFKIKT